VEKECFKIGREISIKIQESQMKQHNFVDEKVVEIKKLW